MGQGVDDEGAATGVGADQFPLGLDLAAYYSGQKEHPIGS